MGLPGLGRLGLWEKNAAPVLGSQAGREGDLAGVVLPSSQATGCVQIKMGLVPEYVMLGKACPGSASCRPDAVGHLDDLSHWVNVLAASLGVSV